MSRRLARKTMEILTSTQSEQKQEFKTRAQADKDALGPRAHRHIEKSRRKQRRDQALTKAVNNLKYFQQSSKSPHSQLISSLLAKRQR
jgi:hypothetical protein